MRVWACVEAFASGSMQSMPHPKASPNSNPEADFGCQVSGQAIQSDNILKLRQEP